jgi:hypothetical protein
VPGIVGKKSIIFILHGTSLVCICKSL